MTEAEWRACAKPDAVLQAVFDAHLLDSLWTCERELRLFGCACCRRAGAVLPHVWNPAAVEVAERFADGQASEAELHAAQSSVNEVMRAVRHQIKVLADGDRRGAATDPRTAALREAEYDAYNELRRVTHRWVFEGQLGTDAVNAIAGAAAVEVMRFPATEQEIRDIAFDTIRIEKAAQANLLRCIFGNPFRATPFSPEWRTDTAVAMARQMYELRDFSGMPILADALQDAGCESEDVLQHCREGNQHARGCWVVDAVLGRA